MIDPTRFHVADIPDEGLQIEGEADPSLFALPADDVQPVGPLVYSLTVYHAGDSLHLSGAISCEFKMQCVRTLKHFNQTIELDPYASDIELNDKSTIDLTERLREDILLDLPAHPVCDRAADEPLSATGNALEPPASDSGDQEETHPGRLSSALREWEQKTGKKKRTPPPPDHN